MLTQDSNNTVQELSALHVPSHGGFSKSGRKGPRNRGRGRSVRFGGLNVLYDEAGNEYPVDDAGQLYVPLRYEPAETEEMIEEEKTEEIKNEKGPMPVW